MRLECKSCIFEITKTETGYHKRIIVKPPEITPNEPNRKKFKIIPCDPNCDKKWCIKTPSQIVKEVKNAASENS